jgi:tetratricopeptide (TPR) repeat protein
LKGYGKNLPPEQMEQIAENKMMENTLVLRTLLDELRVSGVHEELGAQITRYLDARDIPAFFDLVIERLETAYNDDKPKTNFVSDVFSLIAVSRAGLSETELLAITGVAPLYWSQLYAAISMHLVTKNGLLSFSHQFLRDAVWKRYLSKKETENGFRKRIVTYCKKQQQQDSNRIDDELPHQYYELWIPDELYDKILFPRVFKYYFSSSKNILYKYWKILHDKDAERYSIKKYADRLKKSKNLSQEDLGGTLFYYVYFLHEIKQYDECLTLCEDVLSIYGELAETNPEAYLPNLAKTLNNLANLHSELHKLCGYVEAEKEYEKALEIYREFATSSPADYQPNLAKTLNNLALLHSELRGYKKEAEKEYAEVLEILRELAKVNPAAYQPDVAKTLNNLANLHSELHRYKEAEKEYEKALEIYRELVKVTPEAYLPDVADTLNNLALLHSELQCYEEAEKEFAEVLEILRELAIANPADYLPDVAMTLNNLANLHSELQCYEEAEKEFAEALEIFKKFAVDNPAVYKKDVKNTQLRLTRLYVLKFFSKLKTFLNFLFKK